MKFNGRTHLMTFFVIIYSKTTKKIKYCCIKSFYFKNRLLYLCLGKD